jgi:hypothetical protein
VGYDLREQHVLSAAVIAATVASKARPAAAFERSADLATASINSDLFMYYSNSFYVVWLAKRNQLHRIKGYFALAVNHIQP